MSKTFVERVKKATEETVDKFLDKLPDDDKVIEKVGGVFSFFGKKIKKIDKKLGDEFDKFERKFRDDPSPQNLSEAFEDFKKETNSFVKDVKKIDFCKKLINFLGSTVELITSIGKPKELSKAWDNFTKSAKELGKAISKSLSSEKTK